VAASNSGAACTSRSAFGNPESVIMSMSTGGGGDFNSDINVTPMVDIMLVLLIIFMVITPFLSQGAPVTLPNNMNNAEVDQAIIAEKSVVVSIGDDGKYYLGATHVDAVDKLDLGAKIKARLDAKGDAEHIVYIKSSANAEYGKVVEVINIIRQQGVDKIGLVADKKKGKSAAPAPGAPAPPAK
jgi:biopolymer transport protein TolR